MNYRHATILATEDFGPSGTKIVDIDIKDVISGITIRHAPVGGSTANLAHPIKNIERLEIVDGSDVLYGLTGYEGQALNVFEAQKPELMHNDIRVGGTPLVYVHMMFGRKLWDPLLALDPQKFGNLQLKIKWNEANYDANCSSHSFMVIGHSFDQKVVSPMGFLMNKEQKTYTPSSGSWEYTSLPTDYPIRKLILKGLKYGAGVRGLIEDIKLDEDNDKRIILNGDIWELRSFLDVMGGDAVESMIVTGGTTQLTYYVCPSNVHVIQAQDQEGAEAVMVSYFAGGRTYLKTASSTAMCQVFVRGKNPHGCISIPFGDQEDPNDWWNTPGIGKARLSVKGGTSSASGDEINVVTQQLRPY